MMKRFLILLGVMGVIFGSAEVCLPAPIQLWCPWTKGEVWQAGGKGFYYGDGSHTVANNDYYAIDFNKKERDDEGKPIRAAADGTISDIGSSNVGGWYVKISHAENCETYYGYLKFDPKEQPKIQKGQSVKHGCIIGYCGKTGSGLTGPHLHFSLKQNGKSCQPSPMSGQTLNDDDNDDGKYLTSDNAEDTDIPSEIEGQLTAGSYRVTGDVTVLSGKTLTIDPDVTIKFNPGCKITANGILTANGEINKPPIKLISSDGNRQGIILLNGYLLLQNGGVFKP